MISFLSDRIRFLFVALVALLITASGASAYLYRELSLLKNNPNREAQKETEELVAAVGELILLPADETPTIATITDPTRLEGELFFAHAKAGDKVLIFPQSRRAYLYDPAQKKLIEVASLNAGSTGPENQPETEANP